MSQKQAEKTKVIMIPALFTQLVEVPIVGTSSLLMHRFTEENKAKIQKSQSGAASSGQLPRDPKAEYEASMYLHPTGGYAMPAEAIKKALVRAGKICGIEMTTIRAALFVQGDWIKVEGKPRMHTSLVRIGRGIGTLRYRAEFPKWTANVVVEFNKALLTAEQVFNLRQIAGFSVGIGDWRPEKNGSHGRWQVCSKKLRTKRRPAA